MRDDKVPVTLKLLDLRMAEVKGEVTTHRLETKAEFAKIDARFEQIDQRFTSIDQKFDGKFNTLIAHMDAKFEALYTLNTKTLAIVEEQNLQPFCSGWIHACLRKTARDRRPTRPHRKTHLRHLI